MVKHKRSAIAAALVLLLGVECNVWFWQGFGETPLDLDKWTFVPISELSVQGAKLNPALLTSDSERFVAVGETVAPGGAGRTASWTSVDGWTWREGNLGPVSRSGGRESTVTGLARFKGGFIAVGSHVSVGQPSSFMGSNAWTSTDGATWKAIGAPPIDPPTFSAHPTLVVDGTYVYARTDMSDWWKLGPDSKWQQLTPPLTMDCAQVHRDETARPALFLYGHCSRDHGPGQRAALFTLDFAGQVHDRSRSLDEHINYVEAAATQWDTVIAAGYRRKSPESDEFSPSALYSRSTNRGATWSPGKTLPGLRLNDFLHFGSMTSIGSAFLMSGLIEREGANLPALWTSRDDGRTWRLRRLPAIAESVRPGDPVELNGRIAIPAFAGLGSMPLGMFFNADID